MFTERDNKDIPKHVYQVRMDPRDFAVIVEAYTEQYGPACPTTICGLLSFALSGYAKALFTRALESGREHTCYKDLVEAEAILHSRGYAGSNKGKYGKVRDDKVAASVNELIFHDLDAADVSAYAADAARAIALTEERKRAEMAAQPKRHTPGRADFPVTDMEQMKREMVEKMRAAGGLAETAPVDNVDTEKGEER